MNWLAAYLVGATFLEAIRNYYLIKKGKDPHNWKTHLIRLVIGTLVVWFGAEEGYFVESLIAAPFVFWFHFDFILNLLRDKNPFYLGNGTLDKFQKDHGGEFVWFVWKLFLAVAGLMVVTKPELLY